MKEIKLEVTGICEVLRIEDDQWEWVKGQAEEKKVSEAKVILACFWATMTAEMALSERLEMALKYLMDRGEIEEAYVNGERGYRAVGDGG